MNTNLTPVFAAVLLVAGCASAPAEQKDPLQTAQASAPSQDNKEQVNDKGLVCVEEEKTGTHFVRKVCRTPEQMKEERAAAQEMMRKTSGLANPKQGGD